MFPRLYAIADTAALHQRGFDVALSVKAFVEGGAQVIQLRHKGHFSRSIYEQAKQAASFCRQSGVQFLIDDRADVALLLECGLHVGQTDLPAHIARLLLQPPAILGLSTHNEQQVIEGDALPVDYLALGPIFATTSKDNPDPVLGVDRLRQLRRFTTKPLIAIGGISLDKAPEVLKAGADAVAVIRGLIPNRPSYSEMRALVEAWRKGLGDMV
ncbi:MAG: thiamine phosphate synthase [Bryobacteraceae bacterium]|nr:thiamine phosphate synthase [Bryobacteraceae bacterium]MDW8377271.1 thiamine phosphate synthase [Bryobacterales bacterium]